MRAPAKMLLLVLAVGINCGLLQARNYDIVFERIDGEAMDPQYFGPKSGMHVRRASKTAPSTVSDVLEIIKPLPNDTVVEVILYERRDNKYVPSWLKYSNNFCEYLAKEKRPIFQDFGKVFKLPPSCPVMGTFVVENYKPDDRILPPILPGPEHWKLDFALHRANGANLIKHAVVFLIDRFKAVRGRG